LATNLIQLRLSEFCWLPQSDRFPHEFDQRNGAKHDNGSATTPRAAAHAQTAPLNFFKSYFETGGHFAAGVSLKGTGVNGFAQGTITIGPDSPSVKGIPAGADVLAAFLYWQTVTSTTGNGTTGAFFNGAALDDKTAVIAKSLNPNGTAPCWSSGGATGDGGNGKALRAYRADVLPTAARVTTCRPRWAPRCSWSTARPARR
jgi:hypothetical protein